MIISKNNQYYELKEKEVSKKSLDCLTSNIRLKIIELLKKKPQTVKEISQTLNLEIQQTYYHIKKLEKCKLIKVVETYTINGILAKIYGVEYDALLYILESAKMKEVYFSKEKEKLNKLIIVVGSPDSHGVYGLRARDGYLAGYVAHTLGIKKYINVEIALDTEIKQKNLFKENLIVIGGPLTNSLTYDLNSQLVIKFDEKKEYRALKSTKSNKSYIDEDLALIAKIKNPQNNKNNIIVIGGTTIYSTKIAIYAFNMLFDKLEKHKEISLVVRGIDINGDGEIEKIEILEEVS